MTKKSVKQDRHACHLDTASWRLAGRSVAAPIMIAVVFCLLLALAFWISDLRQSIAEIQGCRDYCAKLDIVRVPVDYVIAEPECTSRLLVAAGIENIHVQPDLEVNTSSSENP